MDTSIDSLIVDICWRCSVYLVASWCRLARLLLTLSDALYSEPEAQVVAQLFVICTENGALAQPQSPICILLWLWYMWFGVLFDTPIYGIWSFVILLAQRQRGAISDLICAMRPSSVFMASLLGTLGFRGIRPLCMELVLYTLTSLISACTLQHLYNSWVLV